MTRRALARATLAIACALALAPRVCASEAYPPDLPPAESVRAAVARSPAVEAARAGTRAEDANRRRLDAGAYEWTGRLTGQHRRVNENPDVGFHEWLASVERPLRLSGKAAIDREIGRQGVNVAQIALNDAMHETARAILKAWFAWLRETRAHAQWRDQAQLLARQRDATARRLALGDASRLELMIAEAAAAQAAAAVAQSRARVESVAADLRLRFPELALPAGSAVPEPEPLPDPDDALRGAIVEHSHELALARAESRRQYLLARRADADRRPDPTVGVHLFSERGGSERVLGLSIAIPLPGEARGAIADRELALAEAAAGREAGVRRRVEAETGGLIANVRLTLEGWRRSRSAAERLRGAADLTERAYVLGETGLAELLTAWRLANDGALQEIQARLDALESRRRLELDAHRLWELDE